MSTAAPPNAEWSPLTRFVEIIMEAKTQHSQRQHAWNSGELVGQKAPLQLKEI
jgi:hypothetical protein